MLVVCVESGAGGRITDGDGRRDKGHDEIQSPDEVQSPDSMIRDEIDEGRKRPIPKRGYSV